MLQLKNNIQKEDCIKDCLDCYRSCLRTVMYSLGKGGEYAGREYISSLLDCVEICKANATLMTQGSSFYKNVCELCADFCRKCVRECSGFGDDVEIKNCINACLSCEKSCLEMARS